MKHITIAALALALLSAGAFAYETPVKGGNRVPGDEGYANRWFQPKSEKVTPPGTAFGLFVLTPAPGGRPPSDYQVPRKKRDQ